MDRFAVGQSVALEIDYVDYNGDTVTPTAVSYTVKNELDEVLAADVAVAGPYTTKASFTVAGNLNTPAGGRLIELKMTTAAGDIYAPEATYQVRDKTRLVFLTNSFNTYLQAQMLAADMPNLDGWEGSTEDQRVYAMEAAYQRLTRFGYVVKWPEYVDTQNIYLQDTRARITPQMWPVMTTELFNPYPAPFRTALAQAQVIEANSILTSDPIGDKRRAGLLAETIGESKMMFRSGIRALDFGIHRDSFEVLKTYLDFRLTLTRS